MVRKLLNKQISLPNPVSKKNYEILYFNFFAHYNRRSGRLWILHLAVLSFSVFLSENLYLAVTLKPFWLNSSR